MREIAKEAGWGWLTEKKSSAGICFIGKRNFSRFVDKYIPPTTGHFHSLDGTVLGMHTTRDTRDTHDTTRHARHDTTHTHSNRAPLWVRCVQASTRA